MEPIKIESGYVSGTILGEPGQEVHVYRGIPYAAPPMGGLRWKPPQPLAPWPGIRECTVFSNQAAQLLDPNLPTADPLPSSEDCLYLNVITPAKNTMDRLPVMVWMHGAGFRAGHGNGTIENGIRLPQHGAVLVTINMRVAFIGLMAHPLLSRESPNCVSGNYMCLDMIAALEWIQKNIAAFGGDPANVTIFGESGGGSKVIALMCSPLAKGLFHQAIIESGGLGLISGTPLKVLESIGEKLFAKLGIDKEKDPLAAARTVSWEEIVETSDALGKELNIPIPLLYDITLDGWFLPDTPANIFRAGKQNAVPFIIGANLGELTNPGVLFPSRVTNFDEQLQKMVMQFREQIPNYILMFSGAKKAKVKGYAYIFDQVPSKWRQEGAVSCHAMDIPYVFGAYDEKGGFKHLLELAHLSVANSPDVGVTDVDRKVSEAMMTMWAQFAKTGNPSVKGLIKWPAYKAATDQYLYITEHLEVKSGFSTVGQK